MDLYKIAFVELFLISILGILIFGSNLRVFEYKITRIFKQRQSESATPKAEEVAQ